MKILNSFIGNIVDVDYLPATKPFKPTFEQFDISWLKVAPALETKNFHPVSSRNFVCLKTTNFFADNMLVTV